ncbi:hypothetical protein Gotur_029596 [Gossypium turneri]
MPKPCPRHGLTWDVSCMPMPYPRYGLTWEFSYRCPCHVLDIVLRGTSHLGVNAMSQTWSCVGHLIISIMPMLCLRHVLHGISFP